MNSPWLSAENDIIVPISALEHYSYCPRQCALIHIEQTYDENVFTVRGRISHERVDLGATTAVRGVKQLRALPLWSDAHGLSGKADVVEMRPDGPVPVEYKVGKIDGGHAALQLCAQAICLEEMFESSVSYGFLYSYSTKRRIRIELDDELRRHTLTVVEAVRTQFEQQSLPSPVNDDRCRNCSLINACLPSVIGEASRVRGNQGALFTPATVDEVKGWFDV